MRARMIPTARPTDRNPQENAGLGRAFAVAVVFIGGMYAIATSLIGMM
jgi:hypothetical protein